MCLPVLQYFIRRLKSIRKRDIPYRPEQQVDLMFFRVSLLQAEIQQVNSDGGIALHTRSLKYGKVCGLAVGCWRQFYASVAIVYVSCVRLSGQALFVCCHIVAIGCDW